MRKVYLLILCLIFIVGCSVGHKVNYVKAKELIINNQAIMVDVRTGDEYNEGHIDGALLLTVDGITEESAKNVIGDTDTYVIVYCKSGVRSNEAYEKLKALGYEHVYDLGSMDNWKE